MIQSCSKSTGSNTLYGSYKESSHFTDEYITIVCSGAVG